MVDWLRWFARKTPAPPPRRLQDAEFGEFVLVERHGGWEAALRLPSGESVEVTIEGGPADEALVEEARVPLRRLLTEESRFRRAIAERLSVIQRDFGYENPLSPEQLFGKIHLASAYLSEDGGTQVYYEAEDALFSDHLVEAWIDPAGEIADAYLSG